MTKTSGEIILEAIRAKLEAHPIEWRSKQFDCLRGLPFELRAVAMMDHFEQEIINGGLAQFLWNTFYHWDAVLNECELAYRKIGAIKQAEAIPDFRAIIAAQQEECGKAIAKTARDKDQKEFLRWYELAEKTMSSDKEDLFYSEEYLDGKRIRWLA